MTEPPSTPPPAPLFATISEAFRAVAASSPASPALSCGAEELSYGELGDLVQRVAARLAGQSVGAGDRVAILGVNSIEWVAAFLACLDCGAVAVPLNYRLGRLELAGQLSQVQPHLILCDEALQACIAATTRDVVTLTLGRDGAGPGSIWSAEPMAVAPAAIDPRGPALISFTSGSTGMPKGAVLSHEALAAAANAYASALGTQPEDRTLVLVPLFHNTGFCDQLAHMIVVGGTVDLLPQFGTGAARRALRLRPASFLIAVPGILRLLATSDDAESIFSACRIACYGGSPMPDGWTHELATRWPNLRLYNCYGLTEFTSISHMLAPADLASHPGSVGRPVPGVEQQIIGADGPLAFGEVGELVLAGPSRMLRYWRAPAQTRAALQGRWLRTGDLGSISADGFLHLVGRASEVINRGGEKISPLQVEAALSLEPSIADAAVLGAPHPIFGESVVAFVSLRNDGGLDEERITRDLLDRVADYAVPERFFVLDELPRNAAGKVDRRALRRHAAEAIASGTAS
jgi:long-chain acyl-CoA synthetase